MAYMFQRHRVPVVKEMPTKSEEAAQRRVMDTVTGSGMVLVMQMRNHEKVALVGRGYDKSILFKHSLLHPKELISIIRLVPLKMA
jgi:hypothetical protein